MNPIFQCTAVLGWIVVYFIVAFDCNEDYNGENWIYFFRYGLRENIPTLIIFFDQVDAERNFIIWFGQFMHGHYSLPLFYNEREHTLLRCSFYSFAIAVYILTLPQMNTLFKYVSAPKRRITYFFNDKELYDLCSFQRDDLIHDINILKQQTDEGFDKIRQWLKSNEGIDKKRLKAVAAYQDPYNATPLRKILIGRIGQPPLDIVEYLIKFAPETLQMKTKFMTSVGAPWDSSLLLQYAITQNASLEVIKAIVKGYPQSVTDADENGCLPIHLACWRGDSLEILDFLLVLHPGSICAKTNKWNYTNKCNTPFDCLKIKKIKDHLGNTTDYAEEKDEDGMLPLHHACQKGYSMHLICLLINAYPEGTTVKDNHDKKPAQYSVVAASKRNEKGMFPLHQLVARSEGFNKEALLLYFDANPEVIALPDNSGMLPLHHACLNEGSSIENLMLLVKMCPASLEGEV